MKYIHGNIWDFHPDFPICITTNGIIRNDGQLVMGAGIALQAKIKFPKLPFNLAEWVKIYGNRVLFCRKHNLFSFPTKHNWRDKSDMSLIAKSASQLSEICDRRQITDIYLPKPGCSHGGLEWSVVDRVINKILDDRFNLVIYK